MDYSKLTKEERFIKFMKEHPEKEKMLLFDDDMEIRFKEDGTYKIVSKNSYENSMSISASEFQKQLILNERQEYIRRMNEEMDKKIQRADAMRDLKISGKTLEEIGPMYGVSRERVRQILKSFFPDEVFPNKYNKGSFLVARVKNTCIYCGIVFETLPSAMKKRCSKSCPSYKPVTGSTLEEYHLYHAKRAMVNYYKRKAKDPVAFKEKNRRYNKNYSEKKKMKKLNAASKPIPPESPLTVS